MSVRVTSYESRENLYLRVYKNWQGFFYKLYNFFKSISTSIRFNIYHKKLVYAGVSCYLSLLQIDPATKIVRQTRNRKMKKRHRTRLIYNF